jgi:hypothetical protein
MGQESLTKTLLSKNQFLVIGRESGVSSNRSLQFVTVGFAVLLCGFFLFAVPVCFCAEPSVGVKEGDWIEYNVTITGKGSPPPTHDVRWFRITVLEVQGTAFSANFTVRYANGTIGSAIWKYNFTEGDVRGWTIVPSNLGPGDTFYDYSPHTGVPVNVTIQSEEQKMVLGARRTVTYGSDAFRHKTWDKATGVFLHAAELLCWMKPFLCLYGGVNFMHKTCVLLEFSEKKTVFNNVLLLGD